MSVSGHRTMTSFLCGKHSTGRAIFPASTALPHPRRQHTSSPLKTCTFISFYFVYKYPGLKLLPEEPWPSTSWALWPGTPSPTHQGQPKTFALRRNRAQVSMCLWDCLLESSFTPGFELWRRRWSLECFWFESWGYWGDPYLRCQKDFLIFY